MRFQIILALCATALADVQFTSPPPGSTIKADEPFKITWRDGGNLPSLGDAISYKLALYSGSNLKPLPIMTLIESGDPTTRQAEATVPSSSGESHVNAYFLAMTTTSKSGGQTINYSKRFSISNLTGSFPEQITQELALTPDAGVDGPADILLDADMPSLEIRANPADTPYNEQTGPTKYAPMQPFPGTSITAQNTMPLFPTSSYVIATTILPIPTISTTATMGQTHNVPSRANTAAAQPQPSDDMAKFLNRWKD